MSIKLPRDRYRRELIISNLGIQQNIITGLTPQSKNLTITQKFLKDNIHCNLQWLHLLKLQKVQAIGKDQKLAKSKRCNTQMMKILLSSLRISMKFYFKKNLNFFLMKRTRPISKSLKWRDQEVIAQVLLRVYKTKGKNLIRLSLTHFQLLIWDLEWISIYSK